LAPKSRFVTAEAFQHGLIKLGHRNKKMSELPCRIDVVASVVGKSLWFEPTLGAAIAAGCPWSLGRCSLPARAGSGLLGISSASGFSVQQGSTVEGIEIFAVQSGSGFRSVSLMRQAPKNETAAASMIR
jgi:hypothetical protein